MPISFDENSEFFITIAKQGCHSYLMLGIVDGETPKIIACVGKGNLIDPDFGNRCSNELRMFRKALFARSDALLWDHGINVTAGAEISYQAYSITYANYLEFLAMIKAIHLDQLEHYKARIDPGKEYNDLSYPEKGVRKLRNGIFCGIPKSNEQGEIKLDFDDITKFNTTEVVAQDTTRQEIIAGAKELHATNTCRTTARALLNYTLKYSPNIPALYAIGLDYKTKFGEKVNSDTFYILPQPPSCFVVSASQMNILKELYKKLEDLPKNNTDLDLTRKKFNKLKELYKEISGAPQLPLTTLLDKITQHRLTNSLLFKSRRSHSIFSRLAEFLGFKTGTEQAYDRMQKAVVEEIKRAEKEHRMEETESHDSQSYNCPPRR